MSRTLRPPKILRVILVGVCTGTVLFGSAVPALAHNSFVASSPPDGAVVAEPTSTWTVTFAKDVPLDSASAEVIDAAGVRTTLSPPSHGASANIVVFALPAGLSGSITGRWRLVGTDGHVISGRVAFTLSPPTTTQTPSTSSLAPATTVQPVDPEQSLAEVTSAPETLPVAPPETPPSPEPSTFDVGPATPPVVSWFLRAVSYVSLVALGGTIVAELFLVPGLVRSRRVRNVTMLSALGLFLSSILMSIVYVADVTGTSMAQAPNRLGVITNSTAGSMLVFRSITGLALVIGALALDIARADRRLHRVLGILLGLHIAAYPYAGHSRSMRWPVLGVPSDIIHLLGTVAWLGSLATLIAFVRPSSYGRSAMIPWRRLARFVPWAVGSVAVTGVIQTLRLHPTMSSLTGSTHGHLLLIKVAVALVMIGLGWWVGTRVESAMNADSADVELIVRTATIESALGLIVIAVSAALVSSSF